MKVPFQKSTQCSIVAHRQNYWEDQGKKGRQQVPERPGLHKEALSQKMKQQRACLFQFVSIYVGSVRGDKTADILVVALNCVRTWKSEAKRS